MRWRLTTKYSLQSDCGRFYIAMARVEGVPHFTLWDRTEIVGTWLVQGEAKKAAASRLASEGVAKS